MKTFDPRTLARWRKWLAAHHASTSEIWLVFHKKHTGTSSVAYLDALDEALCYGWIDGLVRRLDAARYARRFTPRRSKSKWSAINIKRYAALKKAGRLTPAGQARSPRTGGRYAPLPTVPKRIPTYIARALKAQPEAWAYFQSIAPSHQRRYFGWIHIAKQPETRERRLREAIRLMLSKQTLGLR